MTRLLLIIIFFITLFIACNNPSSEHLKIVDLDTFNNSQEKLKPENVDSSNEFINIGFTKPKNVNASDKLRNSIDGEIINVEEIDFTGDKIPDFICKMKADSTGQGIEYWVSSNYKIIKTTKYYSDGFYYRWFINLDEDPEPEIVKATGDEDYADYTIADQNLVSGFDRILLYINPIILEDKQAYWGYPWDVTNIQALTNGKLVKLKCSLNHKLMNEENQKADDNIVATQKQLPVIFFNGHHTQDGKFEKEDIKNVQWLTLSEIIRQTTK